MAQIAANLQRIKNGQRRYAITPRIPGGFIQPEQLQKYIDVANEFGAVLKLTEMCIRDSGYCLFF